MNDLLHKILKFVDHERGKIIGLVVGVVVVFGVYGCQVELKSPFSGNKVTEKEFQVEFNTAKAKLEAQMQQLEIEMEELVAKGQITAEEFAKWQKVKSQLFDVAGGVATTLASGGAINTTQVVASLLAVAGITGTAGGWLDSNRKNKVIEKEKAKNNSA